MRERSEESQILLVPRPSFLPSPFCSLCSLSLSLLLVFSGFSHLFALPCVCLIRHEAQSSLPALIYLSCRPAPSGLRLPDVFDPCAIHTYARDDRGVARRIRPALIYASKCKYAHVLCPPNVITHLAGEDTALLRERKKSD